MHEPSTRETGLLGAFHVNARRIDAKTDESRKTRLGALGRGRIGRRDLLSLAAVSVSRLAASRPYNAANVAGCRIPLPVHSLQRRGGSWLLGWTFGNRARTSRIFSLLKRQDDVNPEARFARGCDHSAR